MAATKPPIRLNYGALRKAPPLPASYQLRPWYPDLDSVAPQRLDITASGYFLDGIQIPLNGVVHFAQKVNAQGIRIVSEVADDDNFLNSWLHDAPNSHDQDSAEELALSFYSASEPVGPFTWGTFEFEEDKATLVGILAWKDRQNPERILYVTGTRIQSSNVPSAETRRMPPPPGASDLSEMLTLTFPGLTQATCDVMNEDFGWAVDEQWRSQLMSKTRPDIGAGLPSDAAAARLQFLDENAEWFNTVFGPASLGIQLYGNSQQGAPNYVEIRDEYNITAAQAERLKTFLHGPMGNMAQAQQEHLLAARIAHFRQNPRLLQYAGHGQAMLDRLRQPNNGLPGIITFLGLATMDPNFQNPAMKLTGRYAGLLGALDTSGKLEQQLRAEIVGVTLLHAGPHASFTDKDDMAAAFQDVIQHIVDNQASVSPELFDDIKTLLGTAKSVKDSAIQLAADFYRIANAKEGEGKFAFTATQASNEFEARFPGVKLGSRVFYALVQGYGVYMSVRMYMNWSQLTPKDRANLIFGSIQQTYTAFDTGKAMVEAFKALAAKSEDQALKEFKALSAMADAVLDENRAAPALVDSMRAMDASVFEKANAWLSDALKSAGEAVDAAKDAAGGVVQKISGVADGLLEAFPRIAKMVKFLGPATAFLSLISSVTTLLDDIKSGNPLKIALDAVSLAVDTALAVCALIDAVVSIAAVTVIGIVLVAVSLIITAVIAIIDWIFGRRKPESTPEHYMADVVRPFVSELPEPAMVPTQIMGVAVRGQMFAAVA